MKLTEDIIAYRKAYYIKNKAKISAKHKEYRKQHKPTLLAWFQDYKRTLACIKCGENFPACLHFHHRDASTKRFTISAAIRLCVCREEILAEIEKCDVLCANCHAKQHYS